MDAVKAAAKSVGRINPSHISLKQLSHRFLLSVFIDESSVLCVLLLGVGTSGDVKDTGDLERDTGWVNASDRAIDDETTAAATTQAFLAYCKSFIVVLADGDIFAEFYLDIAIQLEQISRGRCRMWRYLC